MAAISPFDIYDIVGIIARKISLYECIHVGLVCKLWNKVCNIEIGKLKITSGGMRDRALAMDFTIDGANVRYVDLHGPMFFCYMFGRQVPKIVIYGQKQLTKVINRLGPYVGKLPFLQEIPVDTAVRVGIRGGLLNNSSTTICGVTYTAECTGQYLYISIDDRKYVLTQVSIALCGMDIKNAGFIMIGGVIWCADAAVVVAVGAFADYPHVYIHVLTAVLFFLPRRNYPIQ